MTMETQHFVPLLRWLISAQAEEHIGSSRWMSTIMRPSFCDALRIGLKVMTTQQLVLPGYRGDDCGLNGVEAGKQARNDLLKQESHCRYKRKTSSTAASTAIL